MQIGRWNQRQISGCVGRATQTVAPLPTRNDINRLKKVNFSKPKLMLCNAAARDINAAPPIAATTTVGYLKTLLFWCCNIVLYLAGAQADNRN